MAVISHVQARPLGMGRIHCVRVIFFFVYFDFTYFPVKRNLIMKTAFNCNIYNKIEICGGIFVAICTCILM